MIALTAQRARLFLTMLWIVAFVLCIILIFILRSRNWIEQDTLQSALGQIQAVYSAYLASVIAYSIAKRDSNNSLPVGPFWLAFGLTFLWNSVIVYELFEVLDKKVFVETSLKTISFWGPTFSWLVAPF